jgi:hypothetical protein
MDKSWLFEIDKDNTGTIKISEPLLSDEYIAEERARAEFLINSYASIDIEFKTYRSDIELNDILNIQGLPYLVKGISARVDKEKIVFGYLCRRYE